MEPILDNLLDVITKPTINILEEKYTKTFDNIDKLKEKGVELEGVDKSKLEESKNKAIKELKKKTMAQLKKFGSSASLLADGTISLVSRIAGSAAGIISITPVGPGISPNLLMPLLQQLKGEGDNLSKVFDDTKSAWDELGLEDKLESGEITGEAASIVSRAMGVLNGIYTTAKVAIMAVGSSCDGKIIDSLPSPDLPINPPEYKPTDCDNYAGTAQSTEQRTAENCTAYEELLEGKERSCNNCKKFKK